MARMIISLMLLFSMHAATAQQPLVAQEQALLWRITVPGQSSPAYLFGTIHSEDARVLELPVEVEDALQASSHFVMELVPDAAVSQRLTERMLLPDGQTLSALLTSTLYTETLRAVAAHGIPAEAAKRMRPWALVMILNMPRVQTGHYLDLQLYEIAVAAQKQTSGLETADEQIDALDQLSMRMQIELLRHTVEHYEQLPQLTEALLDAWLRRDLEELQRLGDASNEGLPGEIEQALHQSLLEQRNVRMVERMTPRVAEGGVFVAVGALHLPGAQGLIALLRQRGFTLRPVY